jgi:hypothetical protein
METRPQAVGNHEKNNPQNAGRKKIGAVLKEE